MPRSAEKQSLLKTAPEGSTSSEAKPPETENTQKKALHGKRERLQRNRSLEKVDEDMVQEKKAAKEAQGKTSTSRFGCTDYFGVRSYLHNFYETRAYKDPDVYEEDDYAYLLNPRGTRRRRCTSIWWKVFVWIGANFLIFGIIGVLVGYMVPQRPIIVGSYEDSSQNVEIIDRGAISFNFNLDVCKLVGLILFCIGGLTLTVALLFPSFLYQYCDEERRGGDGSFKVSMMDSEAAPLPVKSPLEMSIPSTSNIKSVQPERKTEESLVTNEGMVAMKE